MNFTTTYTPFVSIVIPVKNGARTLPICLRAIKRSYYKQFEVLIVDDHSTDESVEIARQFDAAIISAEGGSGANFARNLGAEHAKGDILIFIDSDIVVKRETILGIVEALEDPHVDAVVGIYSAMHRRETLVSQYKNLWVRYSYMKSPPAIDWLFGAISGIRSESFKRLGGFNVELLAVHGQDDIELGKRFANAKLNIVLDMEIEVEHLKMYTLLSFVKNEFNRSMGFAELAARLGETSAVMTKGFVNVYPEFIISTVFSVVLLVTAGVAWCGCGTPWYLFGAIGVYLLLNIRFLNYLEQVRGLFAMVFMVGFLFLDHLVCFVGSMVGLIRGTMFGKKSSLS